MESVLRRLGLKKSDGRDSEARRQLQKELFAFNECGDRGFPLKPSSLAYDTKLSLLAVGTRTGVIKIYGRPGVYFDGQHSDNVEVVKLCFLPEQARLVTLCSDNSLHLWEYNEKEDGKTTLDHLKSFAIENSELQKVTTWCLTENADQLVLGTDGGNVNIFDIATFSLTEKTVLRTDLIQNAPEDFKVNAGSIKAVLQQPRVEDKFLVAFSCGLIVLWDTSSNKAQHTYNASQQLESVVFNNDGTEFMTTHSDGSYILWATNESAKPKDNPIMPYGPFPCRAITAVNWKIGNTGSWIVFAGGMPKANFQDKNTVSITHGDTNVALDFSSPVVDFLILSPDDNPDTLLVLTEEELVAIDLSTEGWPAYRLPYLANVGLRSPVTSVLHVTAVTDTLLNNIVNAGSKQFDQYSTRAWAVTGGLLGESTSKLPNVLLTGHADGSVSFWDVSLAGELRILYTLDTADVFAIDSGNAAVVSSVTEEEWPPFRKVGVKHSSVDDPRLVVHKMALCTSTNTLFVAGAGGQIVVFKVSETDGEHHLVQHIVDLTGKSENFDWSGPEALALKTDSVGVVTGFQLSCVVQLYPATKCTSIVHDLSGELIAAASEHGLGVFDLLRSKTVYVKSVTAQPGLKMSRSRSFQRSLRDSFRQLRRHRSESDNKIDQKIIEQPEQPVEDSAKEETKAETIAPEADVSVEPVDNKKEETVEDLKKLDDDTEKNSEEKVDGEKIEKIQEESAGLTEQKVEEHIEIELTPIIEETPKQETVKPENEASSPTKTKSSAAKEIVTAMSTIGSLSFANTVLLQGQESCTSLWVGTVSGDVFIFQLSVPESEKRNDEDVKCILAKEIHLKHGAPVVETFVIDRNSRLVTDTKKQTETEVSTPSGGHRVVVCTQQQVKIFSLPSLKALNKYKLPRENPDSRIVHAQLATFVSKSDEAYSETDLVCLSDNGKVNVLSIPQLRSQIQTSAIFKQTEESGAVTSVLTSVGGVYLQNATELKEFTWSAHRSVPLCQLPLKEGMRPAPEPTPVPEVSENLEAEKKTEQPTSAGDSEKAVDESVVSANDSLAAGDVTVDSIKVHVKEESSAVVLSEGDSHHKIVETMVHSVKIVGGVTEESKTTTVEEIKKIEGMMSSCTVTSSTSSSTTVEETTLVNSSTVTANEG